MALNKLQQLSLLFFCCVGLTWNRSVCALFLYPAGIPFLFFATFTEVKELAPWWSTSRGRRGLWEEFVTIIKFYSVAPGRKGGAAPTQRAESSPHPADSSWAGVVPGRHNSGDTIAPLWQRRQRSDVQPAVEVIQGAVTQQQNQTKTAQHT